VIIAINKDAEAPIMKMAAWESSATR